MANTKIKKWDFTIERGDGLERTVVGRDGRVHHPKDSGYGRDGHFTVAEEGEYHRVIEAAVACNSVTRNQTVRLGQAARPGKVIRVGTLEYDSFGLLPSDGFGRLSSEDF